MLPTNADEAVAVFKSCKNLNAALKNFLKKEASASDQLVRFAKDFRAAAGMGFNAQTQSFIERNFKNQEWNFLLVARYAHSDTIGAICDRIVSKYSDEFNATYNKKESSIEVHNKDKFTAIVKDSYSLIESGLNEANLPSSNFIKSAVLLSIFDEEVLANETFRSSIGL